MHDPDRHFGVFQAYRPRGDGVEAVFAGVPAAAAYVERIRAVCAAAVHENWERDAYFIVRTPRPTTESELLRLGGDLLDGLRFLAPHVGRADLTAYLEGVTRVVVLPPGELDRGHDDQTLVHEAVGDYHAGISDDEHPAGDLREGFYSAACDYWLAWFLQWPYYHDRLPRDVFRPYFELWARGHGVAFRGTAFTVGPPAA